MCMKVYVSAHVKMFMTFRNGFMFFAASLLFFHIYIYIHVIMNRHGSHNIRHEIAWAQTSHSTCTCTATLLVVEL